LRSKLWEDAPVLCGKRLLGVGTIAEQQYVGPDPALSDLERVLRPAYLNASHEAQPGLG
jgi:hypothetical protein